MYRLAWFAILFCLLCTSLQAQESFKQPNPWEAKTNSIISSLLLNIHVETMPVHVHPESIYGPAAAEADRLIAMFYVLECDRENAELFFGYAKKHDPKNVLVKQAEKNMSQWLSSKSLMLTFLARESENELPGIEKEHGRGLIWLLTVNDIKWKYAAALKCDKDNPVAQSAYARIWMKQHGDWTFANRLGY
jgi:hypothetical protein